MAGYQGDYQEQSHRTILAIPAEAWKLQVHESEPDEPMLIITMGGDDPIVEVKFENRHQLESAMGVCFVRFERLFMDMDYGLPLILYVAAIMIRTSTSATSPKYSKPLTKPRMISSNYFAWHERWR